MTTLGGVLQVTCARGLRCCIRCRVRTFPMAEVTRQSLMFTLSRCATSVVVSPARRAESMRRLANESRTVT